MKPLFTLLALCGCAAAAFGAYQPPAFPYAPAAGQAGSTAIAHESPAFLGWATRVVSVAYGAEVAAEWRTPENALGPAAGTDPGVMVLGRGGTAVLEFDPPIRDGEGFDLAVFENAFRDTFLELAFVEVSSDGVHFVRFPAYSQTPGPVGAFGDVQPAYVDGFAGKYRAGYGTPFDLAVLGRAYAAITGGYTGFAQDYRSQLEANFPFLDLQRVRFIRLVDVVGDGSARDCEGYAVFDPYPTVITAGFDLDAVGVIHQAPTVTFAGWSAANGLAAEPHADTDRDGWAQYLEFVLGSDPNRSRDRPRLSQSVVADGRFILEYWRSDAAGERPAFEVRTAAGDWVRHTGAVEYIGTVVIGGKSHVHERLTLPYAGGTLLVRLAAPAP